MTTTQLDERMRVAGGRGHHVATAACGFEQRFATHDRLGRGIATTRQTEQRHIALLAFLGSL